MVARQLGVLALVGAALAVLVSDLHPASNPDRRGTITGPYSYLLASSTDLGPSHRTDTQVTVALRGAARPEALFGWADDNSLAVRWKPGELVGEVPSEAN